VGRTGRGAEAHTATHARAGCAAGRGTVRRADQSAGAADAYAGAAADGDTGGPAFDSDGSVAYGDGYNDGNAGSAH